MERRWLVHCRPGLQLRNARAHTHTWLYAQHRSSAALRVDGQRIGRPSLCVAAWIGPEWSITLPTLDHACTHTHTYDWCIIDDIDLPRLCASWTPSCSVEQTNKKEKKEKPGLAGRPGARGSAVMSTFDRVYSCGASMTSTKPVCSSVDWPRMKHHRTHPRSCLHTHTYDWCIIDGVDLPRLCASWTPSCSVEQTNKKEKKKRNLDSPAGRAHVGAP